METLRIIRLILPTMNPSTALETDPRRERAKSVRRARIMVDDQLVHQAWTESIVDRINSIGMDEFMLAATLTKALSNTFTVEILLAQGARATHVGHGVVDRSLFLVKLMLAYGADTEELHRGRTPLWHAIVQSHSIGDGWSMVSTLLEYGADPRTVQDHPSFSLPGVREAWTRLLRRHHVPSVWTLALVMHRQSGDLPAELYDLILDMLQDSRPCKSPTCSVKVPAPLTRGPVSEEESADDELLRDYPEDYVLLACRTQVQAQVGAQVELCMRWASDGYRCNTHG